MLRRLLFSAAVAALAPALLSGCPSEPYFGDGPELSSAEPAWENGNLGGGHMTAWVEDLAELTDEEEDLLEPYIVTVSGSFGDCVGEPLVQFGSRAATFLAGRADSLQVLAPPGPVGGGKVDISVTCDFGASVLPAAYDYVLGAAADAVEYNEDGVLVDEDGEPIRRLEPVFENEYASFTLFYTAEPFMNLPSPAGYGFFFSQPAPRASLYYGGNPGMFYAGEDYDSTDHLYVPAQLPEIDFEAPEQGGRIQGGPEIVFFRERNTSDLNEVLTAYARKRPLVNEFASDPYQPDPHTPTGPNSEGVWLGVPFTDDDGLSRIRYLRVSNDIGRFCAPFDPADEPGEGCGEGDDDLLDDVRIPVDFRWKWLEPDVPNPADLETLYPFAAPEHLDYLACVAGGNTEDACEDESGIGLPSGTYDNAFLCRSFDEEGDFPWVHTESETGFCIVVETLGSVEIVEGQRWVDIDPIARGAWPLSEDNRFYDGIVDGLARAVGENVQARGEPVFISYDEGFYRGDLVPAKNLAMEIPEELPAVGSSEYSETPYIEVPPMEYGTFDDPFARAQNSSTDDRVFFGFPALLPFPGEDPVDWRFPLPGGTDTDGEQRTDAMNTGGWDDTYFILTLEALDLSRPSGLDNNAVWKATAWAWAGDDYITFPGETLATLPAVADITRPDTEVQNGSDLLGIARLQVHRTASWELGEGFRDAAGRAVFDVNAEWQYYFHNQHSCFDGLDNDGDGLCDVDGCDDADGNRLDADPGCQVVDDEQPSHETAPCQDGEDNDEDGFIDMDDPDCDDPNDVLEDFSCGDGVDNDGDGWIDFPEDPGCESEADSGEGDFSYLSDCNDSIDNDGDGMIDSEDPGCEEGGDLDETHGDGTCSDGIDNNGDGWTDQDDFTCRPGADYTNLPFPQVGEFSYFSVEDFTAQQSAAFQCSNVTLADPSGPGIDDDLDGLINAEDPECWWGWDPSGESAAPDECSDRIDNDGDGWVDELDAECLIDPSSESSGPPGGSCSNGTDDDGDGWTDVEDPECLSANDDEVLPFGPLQCNNQIDDDGDGDVDADDVDCLTGKDNHEEP